MRFYQGLLPAIQWDKEKGAPKCEFRNGVLDTDDEELIEFLHEKGYLVQEDVNVLEAGGTLDHGGFEPQVPVDKDLPSGRPPMDNPEMAPGGVPHKRDAVLDSLPTTEQADLNNGPAGGEANAAQEAPKKRTRKAVKPKTTAKKASSKKTTTSKKSTAKKATTKEAKSGKGSTKKRTIKRRNK